MLIDVYFEDGIYYAKDIATDKWLVIEKSVSFLYVKTEHENGQKDYAAVSFDKHANVLIEVRNYLLGRPYTNVELLKDVCLRSGWYDARLSGLKFSPILEFLERYRSKVIHVSDRYKMSLICKQLTVSMRDVYTLHPTKPFTYAPGT